MIYFIYYPPPPQAVAPVLANPNEPVSDLSYFDCLDVVVEKSRVYTYIHHYNISLLLYLH